MALHYAGLASNEETARLITHDAKDLLGEPEWLTDRFIQSPPRALLFLDLPPGTAIMPAAIELAKGEVDVLQRTIEKELKLKGKKVPDLPSTTAPAEDKRNYYRQMQSADVYDNQIALEAVEDAARDDDIAWIDFNVALDPAGSEFLHLHVAARQEFDTGVFAYNFVRRGFLHGVRIVGTLKTGPDLNVLAIFER
jgi:hypothetical protein